jgi:hypothetical protein
MCVGVSRRFDVFLRLFVESLLTASRAEIISLAFVLGFAGGRFGVDFHATYGIFYHVRYLLLMSNLMIVDDTNVFSIGRKS